MSYVVKEIDLQLWASGFRLLAISYSLRPDETLRQPLGIFR